MLVGNIPWYYPGVVSLPSGLSEPQQSRITTASSTFVGRRLQTWVSQGEGAAPATLGTDICVTAAQRTEENSVEKSLGEDFLIKQTLVFVIRCQRTQMPLVNLAVRCHKQKTQEEAECS